MVKPTTPITVTATTPVTKPSVKLRHELKHIISPAEDRLLSQQLSRLFPHDANADSHGCYRVSSLYFDTPGDTALRQKLDGVNMREKFRLRYYGNDPSFLRLEKKFKTNSLCGKYSARLTLEQGKRLLEGDIEFLLQSDNALLLEFYSKLRGQLLRHKTVVTYDREAFLYTPGNVRVTLDRNLRTAPNPEDFFNPDAHHIPMSGGMCVLEVKYDEFLPELVQLAVQLPRQAGAYSKYAVCRRYD